MKRIFTALLFCGAFSQAHANFDVTWQTLSGSRASGGFGWDYSYDIGYYNNTLLVDLDIGLTGTTVEQPLRDRWENGIESIWSTNRFTVPISFNVDWDCVNCDQTVTVHAGQSDRTPGNSYNMLNWYLEGTSSWGDEYQEELTAHEVGHMFGLWDEYAGGAVDPVTGLIDTGGLMHTLQDAPTLDYYYKDMLSWYNENVLQVSVPEPPMLLLTSSSLLALFSFRRKKKAWSC